MKERIIKWLGLGVKDVGIVRTGDLAPRGVAKTLRDECTDFNTTWRHIYSGLRNLGEVGTKKLGNL